jgi:HAD superfamily hydrolase (TIGR01490 family)
MTDHSSTAAFFDLDKTIIATSSTAAFSHDLRTNGLLKRSDALRTAYAQFLFMVGGADARQTTRLRDALAETITGWDAAKVRQIVGETVKQLIDPVVYEEALTLIRRHQANGRDVVIVSASGAEVVAPIAELLGTTDYIASRMEVLNGVFTGKISLYAFGPHKADAIRAMAAERGYNLERCYAYSDSITDAPMLDAVGYGFAVNPNPAMRRAAATHGWGILHFRRPVALRESRRRRGIVAGAVVAGVALTTALIWWGVTRRRSDREIA